MYGFVETMLAADSVHEVEGLLPGYQAYHCVRPRPSRGRPHGGITVFLRRLSPLYVHSGLQVTSDPAAGIVWLVAPAFKLTVAVCYFSPSGSAVYGSGVVASDPLAALFAGLREAEARGHKHLVIGDLNIRIGALSSDVPSNLAVPPGLSDPSVLPTLHHLRYVPSQRRTMDLTVPNKTRAVEFLQGLFSVSSVVLNGRAPGDEEGSHTCYSNPLADTPVGASVVDLACASTSLYGLVRSFRVLPFKPSTSKDHCGVCVSISGLRPRCYEVPRPGRRRRVHRPTPGSGYGSALMERQGFFAAMLRAWQGGGVSVEDALKQYTEQLVLCAGGDRDAPAPDPQGSGRRDQPWYDAECRRLCTELDAAWEAWHASRGGVYGTQAGCPVARQALVEARRAYKRCCQAKKNEHAMGVQIDMLQAYFGHSQKDYWKAFFGDRAPQTPLTDVAAWTDYFRSLLGGVPAPQSLGAGEVALKQQLYAAAPRGPQAEMAELNAPVSFAETQQCMALPTGKAPDAQGLTGELLRLAGALAPEVGPDGEPDSSCPVVECAQWLLQSMLSSACVPEAVRTSKLVPVPKSLGPAALVDRDQYRGISVSAVFARFLERLMNQRFERLASKLSLRAPTQCGFRPGYGTLDAIFTLQHLISAAQHSDSRLFVVFVDFKKAFDKVRRDLLTERCRELGVHGPFLDMLVALYEHVCCQVAVNGELGEAFSTACGTKQGSELSPLLFGLFIELLHYLIELKLPGAGPVLGGLRVPDVLYADDVALLSFSPTELQQLVDVLDVFCRLFDMEVNLAPHKTCVVCFRPQGKSVPRGFHLVYRGCEIARQREYVYLGVRLHETRGLAGASDALAASGSKAMHALLARCRRSNLTQFDIKCRMFDVLVEPVLSYASHIWGPLMFAKHLRGRPFGPRAEKVHTSFLRIMTGAGKGGTSTDVLYRDMHRRPVMYHWVVLAVRWWTKLSDTRDDTPRSLAGCVWRADVELALSGCKRCWSFAVLQSLCSLGLLDVGWRQQPLDWVLQQRWEESAVQAALATLFRDRWQGLTGGDPRSAPSQGIQMRTHHAWVYPLEPDFDPFSRDHAAPHTKLCLPFVMLRNLAQIRIGAAHLEIEQGRKTRVSVPRPARLCRLCGGDDALLVHRLAVVARTGTSQNVEDLKHFLLECPMYDDLRGGCPAFPPISSALLSDPHCVASVFQHAEQSALAKTLYKMKVRRADKLGLTLGI